MARVVTFTSDFGPFDEFVGVCHAVIARIAPDVRIIDFAHGVAGVRAGAAALAQSVPHAPDGVHLAVVDPGVGTDRLGVVVLSARGAAFVGPDNGLLIDAAETLGGVAAAYQIAEPRYRAEPVSQTFHGRDVFAPAAAWLATGVVAADLGPPVDPERLVRLAPPVLRRGDGWLESEILRADWYGNVQLAARSADLAAAGLSGRVRVRDHHARIVATFAEGEPGELIVLVDSAGHVALSVSGGNAAAVIGTSGVVRLEAG